MRDKRKSEIKGRESAKGLPGQRQRVPASLGTSDQSVSLMRVIAAPDRNSLSLSLSTHCTLRFSISLVGEKHPSRSEDGKGADPLVVVVAVVVAIALARRDGFLIIDSHLHFPSLIFS